MQFKTSLPRHLPATDAAPASLHRFKYDTAGRLVEANSSEARIEFAYDPAGLRVSETQTHEDHWSYTLAHTYTPLGVLQSSAYPDAPPVQWLSYGSGHLHGVEIGGAAVLAFERDALHREIERQTDELVCRTIRDDVGGHPEGTGSFNLPHPGRLSPSPSDRHGLYCIAPASHTGKLPPDTLQNKDRTCHGPNEHLAAEPHRARVP